MLACAKQAAQAVQRCDGPAIEVWCGGDTARASRCNHRDSGTAAFVAGPLLKRGASGRRPCAHLCSSSPC